MDGKRSIYHSAFIIQWHLTERCNWHCKHCYREEKVYKELTFKELKYTFNQCLELFKALHVRRGGARINIGGGEPFLRKDLYKLLELFGKFSNYIEFQIMTNGSFITNEVAKKLKKLKIKGIQVSLEGLKQTNDKIRGKGSFEKTIKAIKILKKNSIITRVSLTLTKLNLEEIEDLAALLKSIGVNTFGIRRFVPIGRGEQLKEFMLSPLELKDYYFKRDEMKRKLDELGKFLITYGCEDGIFSTQNNFFPHNCGVVRGNHLNIFVNGDILACRRFPVVVGNVLKTSLLDIYFSSEMLWGFRNLKNGHPLCKNCPYFKYCLGGAKCIAYAYFKNAFTPDPQCWRLFKNLPRHDKYRTTV